MAIERIRQVLSGPLNLDQIERYQQEGWRPVAVEWERKLPTASIQPTQGTPFGLRVASDCTSLEENPGETEVLFTMMELMIQDGPYSFIAEELNRRGYLTRQGGKWSAVSVFEMLPRLIEAGPRIFSSTDWHIRRQRPRQQPPDLKM